MAPRPETPGAGGAPRVLALDVGTSSVRAIVADGQGRLLPDRAARRETVLAVGGDGRAELDPSAILGLVGECLDELHGAGHLDGVEAVGLSCMWHAVVGVDPALKPLTPLFTWADTRATGTAIRLRERLPDPEAYRLRTGALPHNTYWTAKLAWLAGQGVPRPRRWLGVSELITGELLGDPTVSVSMASGTGLLDLARNAWDPEALDLAGVDPGELPPLAPRGWTGRLGAAGRRRWPALAEAVWTPATGDGAAANLGSGCDRPGLAAVTIGTSAAIRMVGGRPDAPLPRTLWRYRVDHDRVITGAALSGGGNLYEWAREVLDLPGEDELEAALGTVPPGANGLTVLPFHAGARAPLDITAGNGVIAGLSLTTTAADVVAATMTATCFGLADGFDALADGYDALAGTLAGPGTGGAPAELAVVASGGAMLASGWWQRTLANVLGRAVHVLPEKEASTRGAALTAVGALREPAAGAPTQGATGVPGEIADARIAGGIPAGARTVGPVPAAVEAEREARKRYETLLGRLEYK